MCIRDRVCASVFKLGSGNIEQTLSCAIRDQMNEAEQILAGVTAVSYTHLDVYKRQARICSASFI